MHTCALCFGGGLHAVIKHGRAAVFQTVIFDLALQLVGGGLDRHAGAVESEGEQNLLAQQTLESRGEISLGNGECVAKVQATVHVRVREGAKVLLPLGARLREENYFG